MWQELLSAIALVLIIEGLPYAVSPMGMRRMLAHLFTMPDSALRATGMTLMVIGAVALYVIRQLL